MPTKIKKLVCLFVININLAVSVMAISSNAKVVVKNAFNYTKTLTSQEQIAGMQQAGIVLSTTCVEFENYEDICSQINEITNLAKEYALESASIKNPQLQNNQAKAKFYQLTALMSENRNFRRVVEIGNFYRFAAAVFNWKKSDWQKILLKYRQSCFDNYIKNSVEVPFIRLAKILGSFLVCIKLVDFLKDPGKTFGRKKKNNLEVLAAENNSLKQQLEQLQTNPYAHGENHVTMGISC